MCSSSAGVPQMSLCLLSIPNRGWRAQNTEGSSRALNTRRQTDKPVHIYTEGPESGIVPVLRDRAQNLTGTCHCATFTERFGPY